MPFFKTHQSKIAAILILLLLGPAAWLSYEIFYKGRLCYSVKSPDGRFFLESWSTGIPRLIAMPGDGGCGMDSGYLRLRDRHGKLLRQKHVPSISNTLEWTESSVAIVAIRGDGFLTWPLISSDPVPSNSKQLHLQYKLTNSYDMPQTAESLAQGADPNLPDIDGTKPLFAALRRCDLESARFLLEHGADINIKNKHGATLLDEVKNCKNWFRGQERDMQELAKTEGDTETYRANAEIHKAELAKVKEFEIYLRGKMTPVSQT